MAKIILENNQKCTLHLNVPGATVKSVTIPGTRPGEDMKMVNGSAEVDAELVAEARKSSAVVRQYFAEGWLREVKTKAPEPKAA
jgi:hypothetical protein